jgi:hypothetical protein
MSLIPFLPWNYVMSFVNFSLPGAPMSKREIEPSNYPTQSMLLMAWMPQVSVMLLHCNLLISSIGSTE